MMACVVILSVTKNPLEVDKRQPALIVCSQRRDSHGRYAPSMSINALARHFGLPLSEWRPEEVVPTTPRLIGWDEMCATIADYCDIVAETEGLRSAPESFEALRNEYRYREEYF